MPNWAPVISAVNATPTRVSTTSTGQQTSRGSYGITFSQDMTFAAFFGDAVNLVDGDTNNCRDVFIKSLVTGAVTRVSTTAEGVQGNQDSVAPVFLPGGGKIAFMSWANNLVAGDTNGLPDIFIKDLATGAITRASTFSDGSQFTVSEFYSSTGISAPVFSPDGTKMAFAFQSAGATVYIKDLITGTLTVAVPSSFAEAVHMPGAQFSPDGTKLLYRQFESGSSFAHLYIKDLASGNVTLVSTNAAGVPADYHSESASFSADGTRIVFASVANNLVAGNTGGNSQIYVKDLVSGAVTLVSTNAEGVMGGGYRPVFSPDGTRVAFTGGNTLVPNDANHYPDIFVKDLVTGEIVLVSVAAGGGQSPTGAENAVYSPDGLFVGFYSDNLVQPDNNGSHEVYMARLNLPVPYVEGGAAVQIVPVARVFDQGNNSFPGGSLSVAITSGSVSGDQLSLALSSASGQSIAISGDQIRVNNIVVGTLASTATSLVISLNANANSQTIELLIEAVRISSTSDDPTAAIRTITFTLVDGGGTADGGHDTGSFSRKVVFVPVEDEPGQQMVGTPGPDTLTGGGGNDILDGGGGADAMSGLGGNDSYYVDSAGDQVFESAGQGSDRVYAGADYVLYAGQSVEILSTDWHAGTAAINLGGNELDNIIYGNAGANILYGKGGNDFIGGLGGDDSYYIDSAGDYVQEGAGDGFDRIFAGGDYTLYTGQHVEILSTDWHAGTAAISLGGNELDNIIYGNAGNNILYGKGGNDFIGGLAGDDSYYIDSAGDYVQEFAGGGADRIFAGGDYTLYAGQHVEILSTDHNAGTAAIALGGNELDNVIYGNDGNNILYGKEGNDTLMGLGGNDQFWFNTALGVTNVDTVYGFASGADKLMLFQSAFAGLSSGSLPASAFVTGNAAGDADDRIIYNSATGALSYDADGNGAGAAVQFATLNGAPAIVAGDFTVI